MHYQEGIPWAITGTQYRFSNTSQNRRKGISPEAARKLILALKDIWNLALLTGQFYRKIRRSCLNSRLQFRVTKITADSLSKDRGVLRRVIWLGGRWRKPNITLSACGPTSPPTSCSFAPTGGRTPARHGAPTRRGRTATAQLRARRLPAARQGHRALVAEGWHRPLGHTPSVCFPFPAPGNATGRWGKNTLPSILQCASLFFPSHLQTAPGA